MLIDKKFVTEKSSFMFKEFLKNNQKFKTISHFRRTPTGWLLMLKIMEQYSSDKNLYVEKLIKEIPIEVSSRLSVFAIIDSAVKKGFLEKRNSNIDKRKKVIIPMQIFVDEYTEWLASFSSLLDHKKKNGLDHKKKNGKEPKTLNTD
jgi:DNA-binding MarR family transcriptional regulator